MTLPLFRSFSPNRAVCWAWLALVAICSPAAIAPQPAIAQAERALTVISDIQTADADTGVIIATGNVTIRYPARDVVGVSNIATYFTREQRIVMEGDVDITQGPNRVQGETVTYFVEENFIEALPLDGGQVESIYVFPDDENTGTAEGEGVVLEENAAVEDSSLDIPVEDGTPLNPDLPTPTPTLTPLLPWFNQPQAPLEAPTIETP